MVVRCVQIQSAVSTDTLIVRLMAIWAPPSSHRTPKQLDPVLCRLAEICVPYLELGGLAVGWLQLGLRCVGGAVRSVHTDQLLGGPMLQLIREALRHNMHGSWDILVRVDDCLHACCRIIRC